MCLLTDVLMRVSAKSNLSELLRVSQRLALSLVKRHYYVKGKALSGNRVAPPILCARAIYAASDACDAFDAAEVSNASDACDVCDVCDGVFMLCHGLACAATLHVALRVVHVRVVRSMQTAFGFACLEKTCVQNVRCDFL